MKRCLPALVGASLAAVLLVAAAGCSRNDNGPIPYPGPVETLISGGGGTGGGEQAGAVTIVAIDEQDRWTRVAGATAFVNDGVSIPSKVTDASGTAVFDNVPAGAYSVTVVKAGFVNSTWFGLRAAIVVVPLESRRVRVSGTVLGGSGSGHTYTIEFSTIEHDPFSGDAPKVGEVTDTPTTGDMTWEVEIDKGQTDTLVFTERNNANNKIVNRKTLVIGPYTADQTGVNVTFDGTTGLHEITGTISGLPTVSGTVTVTFRDVRKTTSATSVTGSGTTRTYSMQLPPGRTCNLIVACTFPVQAQEFAVGTGAADNSPAATVDLALSMATVTGSLSNYGAATVFQMTLLFGEAVVTVNGLTSLGYTLTVPVGCPARLRIACYTGGGVLERGLETDVGPFSINTTRNFDLAGSAPSTLTIHANLPARITTDNPNAFLAGLDADDDLAQPAFADAGAVGADIAFDLRYVPISPVSWLLSVNDQDNTDDDESLYIRGNMGSPSNLGTNFTVTLLEVPQTTSPAASSNQPKQVPFVWTPDSYAGFAANGMTLLEITHNATGDKVWGCAVKGSLSSATLPALPASVAALELHSGVTYRWKATALTVQDLDFDNFSIDMLKGLLTLVKSGREVRIANTTEITFTVN